MISIGWIGSNILSASGFESDHHAHDEEHHDDDKHEAHKKNTHNKSGHDGDEHDEGGHDEDEHDEDGHDESVSKINPEYIKKSGVLIDTVSEKNITETITLTGRIILNRDKTYALRARFPGLVQNVNVNWGEEVKQGQILATIESNESLKKYNILSPRDGTILSKNTNIGDVAGEEPLFTIADLSDVWGELHVFPRDLSLIKEGQLVRVHLLENGVESVVVPIKTIFPTADALSQTAIALINIPNTGGKWRPGMTMEGHVSIGKKIAKYAVTNEAIQWLDDKTVVFIKKDETSYEPRVVKLGRRDNTFVEVLSGLQSGEKYVSKRSFIIKSDILKATAEHSH